MIREQADKILKQAYGDGAAFRDYQLETIEATLKNRRTLVVQKTGWGKSIIYFIAAKILRNNGKGTTFIISPLLELATNQMKLAKEKFSLNCAKLNSEVKGDERDQVLLNLKNGAYDVFFTTPETLFSEDLQEIINDVNIGFFVIDEAHCLSDWGHDFRRDFSRLHLIIDTLPQSVPVLCTTATANDRVVADLKEQLDTNGNGVLYISRGDLMRESLKLQTICFDDEINKYAYILDHFDDLPGTGIIYCLTHRDCDNLYEFLTLNGKSVDVYYSDDERKNQGLNDEAIRKFDSNEIKALIATVKLGMGYDKADVGFVVHFQQPKNMVEYYQQIGRAGRGINSALALLLSTENDEHTLNYFIENAVPEERLCNEVLKNVNGNTLKQILNSVNARQAKVKDALDFLEFEGYITKERPSAGASYLYYKNPRRFEYPRERFEALERMRKSEKDDLIDYIKNENGCLLKRVIESLNGEAENCGKCANCADEAPLTEKFSQESVKKATKFLCNRTIKIKPRKVWPFAKADFATYNITDGKPLQLSEGGFSLSKYGRPVYGAMMAHDKYHAEAYRKELIDRAVEALKPVVLAKNIGAVTFVPSLRNNKVAVFAKAVADKLGLKFIDALQKSPAPPQKNQENSCFQCANALNSFSVKPDAQLGGNVILVDDIVDSGWTLTVCGHLLRKNGCSEVIPFCLADSKQEVKKD